MWCRSAILIRSHSHRVSVVEVDPDVPRVAGGPPSDVGLFSSNGNGVTVRYREHKAWFLLRGRSTEAEASSRHAYDTRLFGSSSCGGVGDPMIVKSTAGVLMAVAVLVNRV